MATDPESIAFSTESSSSAPTAAESSFAVVGSQIGVIASSLELSANTLLAALAPLGHSLGRHARISIPAEIDRISVLTGVPTDAVGAAALATLLGQHDGATERLAAFSGRGRTNIELGTRPKSDELDLWLHCEAPRDESASTIDLALAGISGDPGRSLAYLLKKATVAGGAHAVSVQLTGQGAMVHVRLPAENAPTTLAMLAEAQLIVPEQRTVFTGLHRVLSGGRDVVVSLRVAATGLLHELRIGYSHVAWETAVRILVPIRAGHDVGGAMGHVAGALGSPDVSRFTLIFRDRDPFKAVVSADATPRGKDVV